MDAAPGGLQNVVGLAGGMIGDGPRLPGGASVEIRRLGVAKWLLLQVSKYEEHA